MAFYPLHLHKDILSIYILGIVGLFHNMLRIVGLKIPFAEKTFLAYYGYDNLSTDSIIQFHFHFKKLRVFSPFAWGAVLAIHLAMKLDLYLASGRSLAVITSEETLLCELKDIAQQRFGIAVQSLAPWRKKKKTWILKEEVLESFRHSYKMSR